MKLFTFIADYRGGTYISQYLANTLDEALCLWINNVDFFTDKQLRSFKKYIDDDIDTPTKLEALTNVWRICYGVLGALLLLNIVETIKEYDKKQMDYARDHAHQKGRGDN